MLLRRMICVYNESSRKATVSGHKVGGLLGAVPSFKKLSSSRSDDWIDRINHIYSVFLLVIFAVVVSSGQFVGDPIHCWCPANFKDGGLEEYTKSYCWIKNTYYIPMDEQIPADIHEREDKELTYYQWVPLILIFQAFMFKLPNVFWKMLNGASGLNLDRICKLCDETQMSTHEDRKHAIDNMTFFLDRWIRTHRRYKTDFMVKIKAILSRVVCFCNKREGTYLTALYLCVKIFYLANVISQFFILNAFMATDYNVYGFEYIKMWTSGEPMRESPRFPRVTLCDFKIRQLQNIQRWTVQCVLPINLFNEKIFIFLWFWFFFVAFLSAINLVKWLVLITFKRNNYLYVKKYLTITDKLKVRSDKNLCRKFAESYLRDDGCFVARMIGTNSNDMVLTDLLDALWVNYRIQEEPKVPEYTPNEEDAHLPEKATENSPLTYRGH